MTKTEKKGPAYCLRRAIEPAIFSDCSAYDIYERVPQFQTAAEKRTVSKKKTDIVHLVCHVLEPALCRLDACDHLG